MLASTCRYDVLLMLKVTDLLDKLPALAVSIVAYAAAFAVLCALGATLFRIVRGDEVEFAGLRIGSDRRMRELASAIERLRRDGSVKANVIAALERSASALAALGRDAESERLDRFFRDALGELAAAVSSGADDYQRASIWIASGAGAMRMRAGFNFRADAIAHERLAIDRSIAGWVLRHGETIRIADVDGERDFEHKHRTSGDYRSLLVAPICGNPGGPGPPATLAVLSIDAQRKAYFSADHELYAKAFAAIFAVALERTTWSDRIA